MYKVACSILEDGVVDVRVRDGKVDVLVEAEEDENTTQSETKVQIAATGAVQQHHAWRTIRRRKDVKLRKRREEGWQAAKGVTALSVRAGKGKAEGEQR